MKAKELGVVLILGGLVIAGVLAYNSLPESHVAIFDKCIEGYTHLEMEVFESLSSSNRYDVISHLPCANEHAALDALADIPKDGRDEALARAIDHAQGR